MSVLSVLVGQPKSLIHHSPLPDLAVGIDLRTLDKLRFDLLMGGRCSGIVRTSVQRGCRERWTRHVRRIVVLSITLSSSGAIAQRAGLSTSELKGEEPAPSAVTTAPPSGLGSPFSVGTLFGLAIPLYLPDRYVVHSNIVYADHIGSGWDWVQPSVFVVPSVAVKTTVYVASNAPKKVTATHTWAVIVPAGPASMGPAAQDLALWIGLAFSMAIPSGSEVGVGVAPVWTQAQSLTEAQAVSLTRKTALQQGVVVSFGSW